MLPYLQHVHSYSSLCIQIPNERNLPSLGFPYCNVLVISTSLQNFSNVSPLKLKDLIYNNLRPVDINIYRALPKLPALYLEGNRLHCHCQLERVWPCFQDHDIEKSAVPNVLIIHNSYNKYPDGPKTNREVLPHIFNFLKYLKNLKNAKLFVR